MGGRLHEKHSNFGFQIVRLETGRWRASTEERGSAAGTEVDSNKKGGKSQPLAPTIEAVSLKEARQSMALALAVAGAEMAGDLASRSQNGIPVFTLECAPAGSRVRNYRVTIYKDETKRWSLDYWDEGREAQLGIGREALPLWWAGQHGANLELAISIAAECRNLPRLADRIALCRRAIDASSNNGGRQAGDGERKVKVAMLLIRELYDCTLPGAPRRAGVTVADAARRVHRSPLGLQYSNAKSIANLHADAKLMRGARASLGL